VTTDGSGEQTNVRAAMPVAIDFSASPGAVRGGDDTSALDRVDVYLPPDGFDAYRIYLAARRGANRRMKVLADVVWAPLPVLYGTAIATVGGVDQ
jgi:hypothetical protein